MSKVFIAITLLLTGCTATPYGELSLGYQIDGMTDHWLQTGRPWQCSKNIQFNGEVGLEFDNDWTVGYHHQSWLMCGGPFNERPEVYMDDIRITKKFGGK